MRGLAAVISGYKSRDIVNWGDVGVVRVTSVTIKHSKQIGLRVSSPHIFLNGKPRFASSYTPHHLWRGGGGGSDRGPLWGCNWKPKAPFAEAMLFETHRAQRET